MMAGTDRQETPREEIERLADEALEDLQYWYPQLEQVLHRDVLDRLAAVENKLEKISKLSAEDGPLDLEIQRLRNPLSGETDELHPSWKKASNDRLREEIVFQAAIRREYEQKWRGLVQWMEDNGWCPECGGLAHPGVCFEPEEEG